MAYSRRRSSYRTSAARGRSRSRTSTRVRKRRVSRRSGSSNRAVRVVVQLVQPGGVAAAARTLGKSANVPTRARF